jgi:hypothetical protein
VTGIAESTVHEIISDLNFHKVSASLENLCHYQDEGESFMESIVKGDETWIYAFTSVKKKLHHLETPTTKKKKRRRKKKESSAKKTRATVFWDHEDLLLC